MKLKDFLEFQNKLSIFCGNWFSRNEFFWKMEYFFPFSEIVYIAVCMLQSFQNSILSWVFE